MGFLKSLFRPGWEKSAGKGDRLLEQGDLGGALIALENALEGAPEEARDGIAEKRRSVRQQLAERHLEAAAGHVRIGDTTTALERLELAVSFAEEEDTRQRATEELDALREDMARRESRRREGLQEDDADDVDDEELLIALTAAFPEEMQDAYEEADPAFRAAAAALQQGRTEEALAYFEAQPEEGAPALVDFERGRTLLHVGRVDEALVALRRASAAAPEWVPVLLAHAEAAVEADAVPEAEEVLQAAHDLDPEDLNIHVAICRTALHAEDPSYGLDAASEVLARHPGHRGMLLLKGQLLERMGRLDEAFTVFDTAVHGGFRYDSRSGTLSTDVEATLLLVAICLRRGADLDRAEEVLNTLSGVLEGRRHRRVGTLLIAVLRAAGRSEDASALAADLRTEAEAEDDPRTLLALAALDGDEDRIATLVESLDPEQREAWTAERERFFSPPSAEPSS
ncbi:MAG: hypothetical protein EA398_14755 [Deltaproteobacteria bacterium]|nr:MAG: hypothetical protein EA398_14755 [Deltaproteobacteria bacterium]